MISIWNLDLEKCAKIAFKTGKLVHLQNLVIKINREIQELEQVKTCKYLRVEESEGIQRQQMKERLKQEYSYSNWSTSCPSVENQFWYN